ncbi:hypothetical protein V500_00231 [Pseudogymnoascus sp. VKM F-4518 (FW-2643)]|nr:hypothetical protein V500_00231 [Pseudogymnoascus sp. VKM F-4518 (FW-2643)]
MRTIAIPGGSGEAPSFTFPVSRKALPVWHEAHLLLSDNGLTAGNAQSNISREEGEFGGQRGSHTMKTASRNGSNAVRAN